MFVSFFVDHAAGTQGTHFVTFPYACTIEEVWYCNDATLAKHVANYFTLTILDASANSIGTFNTSTATGVALATGVAYEIPTIDGTYSKLAAGESAKLQIGMAGGGAACTGTITLKVSAARG